MWLLIAQKIPGHRVPRECSGAELKGAKGADDSAYTANAIRAVKFEATIIVAGASAIWQE